MAPFPLHTREETPIALDKTRTGRCIRYHIVQQVNTSKHLCAEAYLEENLEFLKHNNIQLFQFRTNDTKLRAQIADHRMLAQELDASGGWVIIKDKTIDSAALFHDLYNDMENLGLE
ncbi:hypothetical protein Tco_0973079 [Tanacetum coccineum]